MPRASVVTLITDSPVPHGVYDDPEVIERKVYCVVKSVTRNEAYEALSHGLHLSWVLVLSHYAEYKDELTCRFEGTLYNIVRTYVRDDNAIELVLERATDQIREDMR